MELVKLRQQQQNTREYLEAMEQRLRKTELKQQQMMNFLARAMQNPNFVQQLVQQKDTRKELEDMITRKRRRPIDQGQSSYELIGDELGQCGDEEIDLVKVEPEECGEISEFEVSDLGNFGVEMQGINETQNTQLVDEGEGHGMVTEEKYINVDEGFWGDLLNEDVDPVQILGGEGEREEDVDVLVEQLGFLGSSPK